jgi:alpha-L-fucosidase
VSISRDNRPIAVDRLHTDAHGRLDRYVPKWTKDDIRFTQKGRTLYATLLDWPGDELVIRSLGHSGKLYPGDVKSITLLGSRETLEWECTAEALTVKFPKQKPCDFAYVLKIER